MEEKSNGFVRFNYNTSSLALFCNEQVMIKLSLYNDGLGIGLWIGETIDGKISYKNKSNRKQMLLTADKVALLGEILQTKFLPAIVNGEEMRIGIFTSRDKKNVLNLYYNGDKVSPILRLEFYFEINDERVPQNMFYFPFEPMPVLKNYHPDNPDNFSIESLYPSFALFVHSITSFLDNVSSASAHFTNMHGKRHLDTMMKTINDIAIKLGLTPSYQQNYSENNNSPVSSPMMNESSSIDDLMGTVTGN